MPKMNSSGRRQLKTIRWWGGKQNPKRLEWILSLLPTNRKSYIEPFGGMASVLLNRPPAYSETYNDLNGRVVNWFKVVRDQPADLIRLLKATPYSRQIWEECCQAISEEDQHSPLNRAYHFTVVVSMNMLHNDNIEELKGTWARSPVRPDKAHGFAKLPPELPFISARFRKVQIENIDAIKLLKDCAKFPNTLIYCDPPYLSRDSSGYKNDNFDVEELEEVLLAQKGAVAISGANEEWDSLGWHKHEQRLAKNRVMHGFELGEDDTEAVWTNYAVPRVKA